MFAPINCFSLKANGYNCYPKNRTKLTKLKELLHLWLKYFEFFYCYCFSLRKRLEFKQILQSDWFRERAEFSHPPDGIVELIYLSSIFCLFYIFIGDWSSQVYFFSLWNGKESPCKKIQLIVLKFCENLFRLVLLFAAWCCNSA